MPLREFQIGKNKVTEKFIEGLKVYFNKNRVAKISVLKSARENKGDIKALADELVHQLGSKFRAVTIGFKIILRR